MFKKMKTAMQRRDRNKAESIILLIDADRGNQKKDSWSHQQLRNEASRLSKKIKIFLPDPNLESWLMAMLPKEKKEWPDYKKPVNSNTLSNKFSRAFGKKNMGGA